MANLGMPDDIGEVIATRELGSPSGPVLLEFGKPQPWSDDQWICGFRITGLEAEPIVLWLPGVDSLFALQLAEGLAGDLLYGSGVALTWYGRDKIDMPFRLPNGDTVIRASTPEETAQALGERGMAILREHMKE